MSTDEQILGRADVNDLEAILAVTNTDVDEAIHAVKDNADAIFTWDYEKGERPALNKLYEKAKHAQWNGETDLDWSIDVDPEKVVSVIQGSNSAGPFEYMQNHPESPFKSFGDKEWTELGRRVDELAPEPVHARRAGRLGLHRQDRRDGAVDRRQVLRVDAGDGRGPSRRGVRQVPAGQAHRPLSDQRPPADAARRHHRGQPLGHDLSRHADHGRGARRWPPSASCTSSPRSHCSRSCCAT